MRRLAVPLLLPVLLIACATLGLGGADQTLPAPGAADTPAAGQTSAPPASADTSVPAAASTDTSAPVLPNAAALPDPNGYQWAAAVSGLEHPVDIQNAGDGSGRLFVIEQAGRIRVVENGRLLSAPFLDITARVGSNGSERGLLGLAFHPRYRENGLFFVNYTDKSGNTVIARFNVSSDPNVADAGSQVKLLGVKQPFANHNGGEVAFGPDGYLYLGLGDGGSGGDPFGNGQSTDTLLGKILRIDVDGGQPYAIPADNPFAGGGGKPEIWAYGLRNPWRFTFDRATGDLFIGDVGQDSWEEIDYVPKGTPGGLDFGWNYFEATHAFKGQPPAQANFTGPVVEYSHANGCSVTGGLVYRGVQLPAWEGVYLYGDYCTGVIWGLLNAGEGWHSGVLFQSGFNITSFGRDEAGEVYVANYGDGTIYRLSSR